MRIDPRTVTPLPDTQPRGASAEPARTPAASAPASVVTITTEIPPPGTVAPQITARIQKIRDALAAGQYPIDLDKLASRIVDDDAARGGRK